jgi:hypothetical protein
MFVDRRLREIAPHASEALLSAYRRVREGTPEARCHALTSCRRALKLLADVLYPASGEPAIGSDGNAHAVTDDKFVNRLRQYVTESGANAASSELLATRLTEMAVRLDSLNALASKGVHDKVSEFEVGLCVTETYAAVSAFLLLHDHQSAALSALPG